LAPLYREAGSGPGEGSGKIRVRVRIAVVHIDEETSVSRVHHGFRVQVAGLRPQATYRVDLEGAALPFLFSTDRSGGASVPFGAEVVVPGARLRVRDPAGNPVLVGTVPPWDRRPGAGDRRRSEFEAAGGGGTVRVESSTRTGLGRERLEFRFEGFAPGAALRLRFAGGEEVPVTAEERGRAEVAWGSGIDSPLPGGAYAVAELSGAPFEVLESGAVVVEGAIP
jgi:hypothetical protein